VKETLPAHEEDDVHVVEAGDATSERHDLVLQRRTTAARGNNEETRTKRHKKGDNLEGIMGRYIDMRIKQAEEEATQLAKEREEKCRRFDRGGSLDRRVNCRCVSQPRWVGARWSTRGENQ
jgi:hypothetical protein